MRHQHDQHASCLPHRLPAHFTLFVASVLLEEGVGIREYMHRIFERHPVLLLEVTAPARGQPRQ